MRVEIELRPFEPHLVGGKQILKSVLDSLARRLDTVIAAGIEKTDEPVGNPQASAANLEDPRLRIQPFVEQGGHLPSSSLLEGLHRDTQETMPADHFLRAGLHSGHGPIVALQMASAWKVVSLWSRAGSCLRF